MQVCNTGNCNDGADTRFADFYFIQTVKLIKLADLNLLFFVRIVVVQKSKLLVYGNSAALNLTNSL